MRARRLLLAALLLAVCPAALAQEDKGTDCPALVFSAQVTLPPVPVGAAVLWARERGAAPWQAGARAGESDVLLVRADGHALYAQKMNRRGMSVAAHAQPVPSLHRIAAVAALPEGGHALLGQTDEGEAWFGILDPDSTLSEARALGKGAPHALTVLHSGRLMAVLQEGRRGRVVILDAQGKTLTRRSYLAGTPHTITGLAPLPEGGALLAGWVESAPGRPDPDGMTRPERRGWLAAVDDSGALVWQQPYGRGALSHVVPVGKRYAAAVGQAPGGALWAMAIERSDGELVWARALRGKGPMAARAAFVDADDGPILRIAAAAEPAGGEPHARLIDITARGDIREQRAYHDGAGVAPAGMVMLQDGSAVLFGGTQLPGLEGKQGWAVGVSGPRYWDNPCMP